MSFDNQSLGNLIIESLTRKPNQKASDLAKELSLEKKDINRCLTYELKSKVLQDASYRWRVVSATSSVPESTAPAKPESELARLCRYYLECVGQDDDEGVSTFAASKYGEPDYVQLPKLPLCDASWDWSQSLGAGRLLGKVRAERANLIAYIGYPVRLRKHKTANWEGFFAEPILLWPISPPDKHESGFEIADTIPHFNFKFLRSVAMGDVSQMMDEAAQLSQELGLNNPIEDQPEVDELIQRLTIIRPDWDWQEPIDPFVCPEIPLAQISMPGIYNRAVVIVGKRSPFTQGLESELKDLSTKSEAEISGTALGQWLSGDVTKMSSEGTDPLLEVLPMNNEQRMAVHSALSSKLTVVTGPPGTGKSQVVTNLLINAAWQGKKVLFASKNNKAVDVVETRVNSLGNRPVLLRLGSKEYQAKLGEYLTAMLSGTAAEDDKISYDEGLERHHELSKLVASLNQVQEKTLNARNTTDQLDKEIESYRPLFAEKFNFLDEGLIQKSILSIPNLERSIEAVDISRMGFFGKLILALTRSGKMGVLQTHLSALGPLAKHFDISLPVVSGEAVNVEQLRTFVESIKSKTQASNKVLDYQKALEVLRTNLSFEAIATQHLDLAARIAKNSIGLWKDWVQLAPARLSATQRKEVADYAAVLQLMTGPNAQNLTGTVRNRARTLQSKVLTMFSCWAVTSLSAKSKVPFEPGYFDLVVIDEASQCDIASALPLLYRAKQAVIIGDPQQLKHISSVTQQKESELQQKYGLIETAGRASWMYSVNSLYDVAAGLSSSENIVNLKDHHRSHADIINFSNREFYGNKLRIATKYHVLKRPKNKEPGVIWSDVKGKTIRPSNGGALNRVEAQAVIDALRDLLITRSYTGTVGIVTPFQAQKQLLNELASRDEQISAIGPKHDLLIDTVHRFQGDERDVILFSPVISEETPAGALSFLRSNGNLFNVAITRARGLLHVVGDRSAILNSKVEYLAKFAQYVSKLSAQVDGESHLEGVNLGPEYPVVSKPEQVSEWEHIFYKALYQEGLRPIPQYPVEQYELDFALIIGDRKLNIEIDGEKYHRSWTGELCLRDQLRNQRLIELGWEVKRFWVYEVRDRLPQSVSQVKKWVEANPN